MNFALRHAELALGKGDSARARALLDQVDAAAVNIDEPQFLGVMGALRAELERRAGDLDAARAAIRRALDRIETCTDDVVRLARVAAVGVVVEADAAQRACDLGDDEERRRALMEAEFHLGRAGAAAEDGGPVEEAWLRSAEAEHARANGKRTPALHEAAAQAWEAVRRPYPAALMRWRAGEAHVAAGRRDAATAVLERAHEVAATLGAGWLRDEIEGLAARARLVLPGSDGVAAEPVARGPAGGSVRPHAARAPGPRARGRGPHEPRDRRLALHGREDGQRARLAHPGQARRAQPHRGCRGRPPPRTRRRRGRRATRLTPLS